MAAARQSDGEFDEWVRVLESDAGSAVERRRALRRLREEYDDKLAAAVHREQAAQAEVAANRAEADRAIKALAESEQRYRYMGETIPFGVWWCNPQGEAEYVSPSFCQLLGMTLEEQKKFGWTQRLVPEDVEPMMTKWLHCCATGTPWDHEHRIIDPQDKIHTVLSRGLPVRDASGTIIAWVGVNLDITDRKRIELQLKEAKEALEQALRVKDQFFANVSHELRTPLMLILGPVRRVLAEGALGEKQRHELAMVERNAGTLLKIVNDLLDLTKLDAGRMSVAYSRVDLAQVARYVAGHFESIAGDKPIRFSVDAPANLPAEIDPEKVQRILFNLLSNAFKFTPSDGAVRLKVETSGDAARLVVDDAGPGVPWDKRVMVFERFRQVEGGATRQYGGTGLGLSIVQEFVRLHRGRVEVADAPTGGARFVVELPLRAPEGATVSVVPPQEDQETARTLLADLRGAALPARSAEELAAPDAPLVLLVEDNFEMRTFIAETLARSCRIVTAADGQEGLAKAIELQPDLIVTDVMMPRMSGEDLVREVRRKAELNDVRILVLTAKADEQLRVRLLAAGAQACLTKPFATEELMVRTAGLIADKRRNAQLLQAERELLAKIIDTIPVMITIYDPEQRAFRFNRELREVLGWTEEDAATGDFMAKVYPDPAERRRAADFMQSLAPGWRDFRVTSKDGTPVLSQWANVRLANNVLVGIGVDIRARRAAEDALRSSEAELRTLNETLEDRVAERTRQLEDANRELEAFSYSVSHDLRAPLRAVAGFSNILAEEYAADMNPDAARYVGFVQNGAHKMGQLIDDLLAFSRLGRQALKLCEVDIAVLSREVIAALKTELNGRRVEWRIGDLPPCQGDPSLLRQVLMNLLSNAVKYSRPREVAVIEVGAARLAENGSVIYHVRDNGVGFEMKHASKLFGVFQRLHSATEFEGTGVGLAIVQRIIHRHGGRIWAESASGVGTTFYFTLDGDRSDKLTNG